MSDAMSQISIDTESKLSPSDFQKLFPGFKGSKMHDYLKSLCQNYTDDLKSLCQEFINLRKNPDSKFD
jgi:hypothetical protein